MFTRMQDIKAGKIDEDGLGINNAETALARVNIELRESDTSFRDFSTVLEELSKKWGTLNEVEQANISKAIAGVRQANIFNVLMNNMNQALELQTEQFNATGLSADRYKIYLESIEAAQNKMTASWENLIQSAEMTDLITSFYNGVSAVLDFVDAIGGIQNALLVVIPLLIIFQTQMNASAFAMTTFGINSIAAVSGLKNFATIIKMMTVTGGGFWATLSSGIGATTGALVAMINPATAVVLAITAIIAAWKTYQTQVVARVEEAKASTTSQFSSIITKLQEQDATNKRTLETYLKIIEATKAGGTAGEILVGGDLKDMRLEALKQFIPVLQETASSWDEYSKSVEKATEEIGYHVTEDGRVFKYGLMGAYEFVDGLRILTKAELDAVNTEDHFMGFIENSGDAAEKASYQISDFANSLKELSAINDIDKTVEKMMKEGLSIDDLSSIPENYLDALYQENGLLKLNLDLVKEKQIAEAEAILRKMESSNATKAEKDIVLSYIKDLQSQAQMTHGVFQQTQWDNEAMLYGIANAAQVAGFEFTNTAGVALNSADEMFNALMSGDAEFNNFVQQLAMATGRTVADITNMINVMIANTANQANALMQGLSTMQNDSRRGRGTNLNKGSMAIPNFVTPQTNSFADLFSGYTPSSGGGGSSGKSKSQLQAEKKIKSLEAQKKALQDSNDEFKRFIELQKESLKLQKEEKQYTDELLKKNQSLAKLKTKIAILSLDDSEEAIAQRMQLEEEAGNLETEIKKDTEDRTYQLKIDALDKALADFNYNMEQQIAGIDSKISKYQEESNAVDNVTKSVEKQTAKVKELANAVGQVPYIANAVSGNKGGGGGGTWGSGTMKMMHSGGFAGGLKSNEVYAKLLKGEYVTTESDMNGFLKKTLPSMLGLPSFTSKGGGGGDISVSMPINVAGNLDKTILPDLKKIADNVIKEINKNMEGRGYNRRADAFSI